MAQRLAERRVRVTLSLALRELIGEAIPWLSPILLVRQQAPRLHSRSMTRKLLGQMAMAWILPPMVRQQQIPTRTTLRITWSFFSVAIQPVPTTPSCQPLTFQLTDRLPLFLNLTDTTLRPRLAMSWNTQQTSAIRLPGHLR